jgi:ribose transport system substrate-binding protein
LEDKMKLVSRILTVAVIFAFVMAACAPAATQAPAPTTAPAAPAAKKVVVGLVMKSLANEFFKIMEEATVKWAATQPNIDLKPVGMNSETDIDTQFAAVENFVTQKVDLIVVAAADSVGMVAPVKKAVDAGIVVVNFDVKLDTAALKAAGLPEDFLFVGPDNAEGAKLAGDAMAVKLGKGGKVIIIEGNPGADNATQRKNGFMKSVEEGGLVLLDSKTAHWETEEANTVVTNLLTLYPDVQGIMCANDSMVLGAVKAIEAAGMTGKIDVVGFDNIPAVQDLIKQGKVLATVDQFGPEMAKNSIEVGLRVLNGEKLTGWIKTPVKLVAAAELGVTAPAAPAAKKVVVGLVMKSLANEFFKIMEEATVKWAATQPNIDLKPVGMNSETDIDTQFAAVENFVTQKADLIVVAAADSVGMVAPVKKAVDAGIVVVNFDVKLDTAALKAAGLPEDFLFVGPDNAEGAKLAGDAMAAKLGKGGKVIIIEGNPGADNATQRKNGFMKSVEEGGLVLLDSKTAHWETEEANTVVTNLLTLYPDVQGIMCANDSMVLGAVKAIEAAGLTGKVEVVGFDNIPAVQDLIKQGKVLATVDQFGPDMAKNSIEVGLRILSGEKLTGWIKTPVKLVTAADLK